MNKIELAVEKLTKATEAFKQFFNAEETPQEETAEFAEATLMDGSTITYEGELAVGTAVFIVVEGESVPAPEGTHALGGELEGVSIVTDASGVITEVIDERQTEEEMSEDSKVDVSALQEPLNALLEGMNALIEENKNLKEELGAFKSEFNEFKDKPSIEETTKKKFNRVESNLTFKQEQIIKQRKNRK